LGRFFLAASASLLASCSLIVDAERVQCRTKADCTARGGAFADAICVESVCQIDPAWACLSATPTTSTQEPPYKVTLLLRDVVDQSPFKGSAQAKLCRKLDVDCAAPVASATSGDGGTVTFSVEVKGFSGYAKVQADGIVPTLYFFNPSIDRDTTVPVSLPTVQQNQGLLFTLGHPAAPGHGNVVISSEDCTGAPGIGVSYSTPNADAMTVPFYTVQSLPSTAAMATDGAGFGGLVNVPVGAATVVANLASTRVELAKVSLLVQEGAITYSTVGPVAK